MFFVWGAMHRRVVDLAASKSLFKRSSRFSLVSTRATDRSLNCGTRLGCSNDFYGYRHRVLVGWSKLKVLALSHLKHARFLATQTEPKKPFGFEETNRTDDSSSSHAFFVFIFKYNDLVIGICHRLSNQVSHFILAFFQSPDYRNYRSLND